MKNLFLVLFLVQGAFSFAQPPGGGGGRSGGGNQQGGPPQDQKGDSQKDAFVESNILLEAGFMYYDAEKVIKETKAKTKEEKESITLIITEYNSTLKEAEKSNKLFLDSTTLTTLEREKKAIASKDFKAMMESKKYLAKKLEPIRKENFEIEKVLLSTMEEKLTEKTHKKWLKYFENNKEKLLPKKPTPPKERPEGDSAPGGPQGGMR